MRKPEEILNSHIMNDDVWHREPVINAMREYAREAVKELVEYGADMKILKSFYIEKTGEHGPVTDADNLQKFLKKI